MAASALKKLQWSLWLRLCRRAKRPLASPSIAEETLWLFHVASARGLWQFDARDLLFWFQFAERAVLAGPTAHARAAQPPDRFGCPHSQEAMSEGRTYVRGVHRLNDVITAHEETDIP